MQRSATVSLAAVVLFSTWAADLAQGQTFDTIVPASANRARVVDVAIQGDGFAAFETGGTGQIKLVHQMGGVELGPVPLLSVSTTAIAHLDLKGLGDEYDGNYNVQFSTDGVNFNPALAYNMAQLTFTVDPPEGFPDTRIAFISDRSGPDHLHEHLWSMDPNGKNPVMLTRGMQGSVTGWRGSFAWSPDGEKIAFVFRDEATVVDDIYIAAWNGKGMPLRITDSSQSGGQAELQDATLAWSPDGNRIAYHGPDPAEGPDDEILVLTFDPTLDAGAGGWLGPENITRNADDDHRPTWAPNGMSIAFETAFSALLPPPHEEIETSEIFTATHDPDNVSGNANQAGWVIEQITDGGPQFAAKSADWAPGSDDIVFVREYVNLETMALSQQIYWIFYDDPGWTAPIQLSTGPFDSGPVWSPDGELVAYTGEGTGVYVVEREGDPPQSANLTPDQPGAHTPSWLPPREGPGGPRKLVYTEVDVAVSGLSSQLYMYAHYDEGGGESWPIAPSPYADRLGTWSPPVPVPPPAGIEPNGEPIILTAGAIGIPDVPVAFGRDGVPPYSFQEAMGEGLEVPWLEILPADGALRVPPLEVTGLPVQHVPYEPAEYVVWVSLVDSIGDATPVIPVTVEVRRLELFKSGPTTILQSALNLQPQDLGLRLSGDPTVFVDPAGIPVTAKLILTRDDRVIVKDIQPDGPTSEGDFRARVTIGNGDIYAGAGPPHGRYAISIDDGGSAFGAGTIETPRHVDIVESSEQAWQAKLELREVNGLTAPVWVRIGAALNGHNGPDAADIYAPPQLNSAGAITAPEVIILHDFNQDGVIEQFIDPSSDPPNQLIEERLSRDIRRTKDTLRWRLRVDVPEGMQLELTSPDIWSVFSYYNAAQVDLDLEAIATGAGVERFDFQQDRSVLLPLGPSGGASLSLEFILSRAVFLQVVRGWNLVSSPGPALEYNRLHLTSPGVGIDTIYAWDAELPGGWELVAPADLSASTQDQLMPVARGYFMHFARDDDAPEEFKLPLMVDLDDPQARGNEQTDYTSGAPFGYFEGVRVHLATGWTLVGAPAGGISASVFGTPANTVFEWDQQRYLVANLLRTLGGYWVFNPDAPRDVFVKQLRDRGAPPPPAPQQLPEPDWTVPFALDTPGGPGPRVELGSSARAKIAYDHMDIAHPPVPTLDAVASFYLPVDGIAQRLTRSVQPVGHEGAEWALLAVVPQTATLTWEAPTLPKGYRMMLEAGGVTVDMSRARAIELGAGRQRLRAWVTWTPPSASRLLANYPNPFNPETWIPFELKEASQVDVRIYDVSGRVIRHLELGYREPGYYTSRTESIYWDGRNETGEHVASGVYFYELRAGAFRDVRRMAILK